MTIATGTRSECYEIRSQVGEGGMAEVAAALRLELMSNEVNNTPIGPVSSEIPQNSIPSSDNSVTSSPTGSISTEPKFKIKVI